MESRAVLAVAASPLSATAGTAFCAAATFTSTPAAGGAAGAAGLAAGVVAGCVRCLACQSAMSCSLIFRMRLMSASTCSSTAIASLRFLRSANVSSCRDATERLNSNCGCNALAGPCTELGATRTSPLLPGTARGRDRGESASDSGAAWADRCTMKSSDSRRENTSKPAHSAYERDETAEGDEAAAEEERGLVTAEEALSESEWEEAREEKADKGTSGLEEETSGED